MNRRNIAIGAAALLILATLGTMYYVAGTPQYSLYLLKKSVADHDRDAFRRYFDIDRVVSSTVERAVGGRIPAGPNVVSDKARNMLIPASEMIIRERLDERFDDPSSAPVLGMKVDSVRYQNNAAFVTLENPSDGSTTALTLERTSDRHWKVVDIDLAKANIQYSLNEARERAEQELPPEMPQVNKGQLPLAGQPLPRQ
jgi:hypothetical protein